MSWSAADYDAWFERPWGRYAHGIETAAVLGALGPLVGERVLDVGCGTGRLLGRMASAGASPLGLDRDADMLAVAAGRTGVPLACADAAALPVATASFDAVVAVALLEFVASPADVVKELCRVARAGGRVVIGALNPTSAWGLSHRASLRRPPWTGAHFLGRSQLLALGNRHGPTSLGGALFASGAPRNAAAGQVLERLGRLVPWAGAFQVLTISRR